MFDTPKPVQLPHCYANGVAPTPQNLEIVRSRRHQDLQLTTPGMSFSVHREVILKRTRILQVILGRHNLLEDDIPETLAVPEKGWAMKEILQCIYDQVWNEGENNQLDLTQSDIINLEQLDHFIGVGEKFAVSGSAYHSSALIHLFLHNGHSPLRLLAICNKYPNVGDQVIRGEIVRDLVWEECILLPLSNPTYFEDPAIGDHISMEELQRMLWCKHRRARDAEKILRSEKSRKLLKRCTAPGCTRRGCSWFSMWLNRVVMRLAVTPSSCVLLEQKVIEGSIGGRCPYEPSNFAGAEEYFNVVSELIDELPFLYDVFDAYKRPFIEPPKVFSSFSNAARAAQKKFDASLVDATDSIASSGRTSRNSAKYTLGTIFVVSGQGWIDPPNNLLPSNDVVALERIEAKLLPFVPMTVAKDVPISSSLATINADEETGDASMLSISDASEVGDDSEMDI